MTAESGRPQVHLFLLAGQFPGMDHAAALSAALSYALAAERHGFAGVWMAEHHFISYGVCPSALAFAGHVLGRTSRLRVGTAACVLSNRHPVALAEEAALLDQLSGGRLALGVARGGPWVDLEVFGTGLDRYATGFAESLDLMRQWLSGVSTVAADGRHFRFRQVTVVPRPQRPPPIWVAATSPSTVETAAERGLPVLLGMHATDVEKATLLTRYRQTAARHGHEAAAPAHASAHLAQVAGSDEEAADIVRESLPALLEGTRQYVRIDGSPPAHRDLAGYTERLISIGAVGTPETCRQRLAASVAATGARHVLLMVEAAGDPDRVLRNIADLASALSLGDPAAPGCH
ncbi:MAG TPA: LLM class flavin-dependent oxidoreductase [Asanoa sp.]|nr:LLM class flavin-dependent oxidoreductase [Asanoa sp.]